MKDEESVFEHALQCGSDAERGGYLHEACAGAPALRRSVEELLAANRKGRGVLERTPPELDATVDAGAAAEPLGTQIGPYKLLERLGGGGMGVVYMAEQTHPVRRK